MRARATSDARATAVGLTSPPVRELGTEHDGVLVFVGGLHRSGTTFIARTLAGHPSISGLHDTGVPEDEGEHLQSVYPDSWELGGVGRFGFSPEAHLTEESSLVGDEARSTLMAEWGRYWDLEKPLLLEKSPPNMLKLRFLEALFPESRSIVVVRHPVAVAAAHLKWRPRILRELSRHELIEHWVVCHDILLRDAKHLRNLMVVRYEDLVSEPETQFSRVFDFLGVEGEHGGGPSGLVGNLNERYFDLWSGSSRNVARRRYVARIHARYEARVRGFGYSFDSPVPLEPLGPIGVR